MYGRSFLLSVKFCTWVIIHFSRTNIAIEYFMSFHDLGGPLARLWFSGTEVLAKCFELLHIDYNAYNQATGMTKISRGGVFSARGGYFGFSTQGGYIPPPGKTGSSAFSAIWALIKLN